MSNTEVFLGAKTFAVAGASTNREKYGNKIFRALLATGRSVYPITPSASIVEDQPAYPSIAELPQVPESLSIVTPPAITRLVVEQAIAAGVKNLWMQPGAQDALASQQARDAGINLIDDGSCILVSLTLERNSNVARGKVN